MSLARALALALAATPIAIAAVLATPVLAQGTPTPIRPVNFAVSAQPGGTLVLPLRSVADLSVRAGLLDPADLAIVTRALAQASFGYGPRDTLTLRGLEAWDRVIIIGLEGEAPAAQTAGMVAGRALATVEGPVTMAAAGLDDATVADLATGFGIGGYRPDLYNTTRSAPATTPVTVVTDAAGAGTAYARGAALVEAMHLARDLSNEPANILYPETFVDRTRRAFEGVRGVEMTVLDERDMARLGMGAILGVGQGSERPPRMLAVRYRGSGAPAGGPVVLAGKGITFDTGGISIKPSAGMGAMKMDMSGAASVVAAVLALAKAGAPVDVVAVAALAENMPDGGASRPADVLTAYNDRTIEIISTDAEGRLVLADAVAWADATMDPAAIVDVATLTGAVSTALGDDYAGLFSRHDALADQLEAAGRTTGERLWRLPLHPTYVRDTSSSIADIKNSGDGGAGAGTGAHFIGFFVRPETPWAHIDIAGVDNGSADAIQPGGSTGYGVRLLEAFVRDFQPVPREPGTGGG
ncbi:leucyl aminopeptidase family protein [Brevundimonas sp. R86498]|uniref:leucyl aminopeptidase family protein n=1 Tax=Brevundimonas sp. R86498 TaxID=3093845 RepID=UPI0037C5BB9E